MRGIWILGAAWVVLSIPFATAQEKPPAPRRAEEELHLGAGSCASQACHGGGFESRMEYKVWATKDPHSGAFATLRAPRSRRMAERLGYDVTKAEACLSCHGTTGVRVADTHDMADGVSCELCHGGAKDWLGPHVEESWRRLRPEEKEARYGLVDLSTPKARVAACLSCHVGSENRRMTHEIMAAGHPPLTFDGGKWMRDVHPHWKDEVDRTAAAWLEGLRQGAAAELERLVRAARNKRSWPEFSVFDCYSCHHPIYQGSVYETRKPPGRPGSLALDLSYLEVLRRVANVEVKGALRGSIAPGEDPRELANEAEAMAKELRALPLGAVDLARARANLALWFRHESFRTVPRRLAQQVVYAVDALAPAREAEAFRAAYDELLTSVDPTRPFDAGRTARLAVKALAAGGYPK